MVVVVVVVVERELEMNEGEIKGGEQWEGYW